MPSGKPSPSVFWTGLVSCLAATPLGCSVGVTPELLRPGEPPPVPEDLLVVRFMNLTGNEAVDVEFYAADGPLENLPDDLFKAQNRLTANIGVAGTGIIQPWRDDYIELPCATGLTIGTLGGSFIDNESGELRGEGMTRWAQDGPLGLCGSVVTFEYAGYGGDFTTTLRIGD